MPKSYRLPIQGKKNLTCVGGYYGTVAEAELGARQHNERRAPDGRKPIVAIKAVLTSGRSELVRYLDDETDTTEAQGTVEMLPAREGFDNKAVSADIFQNCNRTFA